MFLALWTHEAAREGSVPCAKKIYGNPNNTPGSPHSGLMKQPAMEGPVSRNLDVQ